MAEVKAYEANARTKKPDSSLASTDPRRIPVSKKMETVIKGKAMNKHLKAGQKLMEKRDHQEPEAYVDLLTDILKCQVS